MSDELVRQLVLRARSNVPGARIVTADEVAEWPEGVFDTLLREGVLQEIQPAISVECDACFEQHAEVVEFIEEPPGSPPRAYIACPEFGRVKVDPQRMRRWEIVLNEPGGDAPQKPDAFRRLAATTPASEAAAAQATSGRLSGNIFRREGDFWTIGDQAHVFHMKDTKGLRYVAHLLRNANRDIHVLDLVTAVEGTRQESRPHAHGRAASEEFAANGLSVVKGHRTEPLLDAQARTELRDRIQQLEEELDEAERNNDSERAGHLKEERDQILEHLRAASGLGGRERSVPSAVERARVNVRKNVDRALHRIEKQQEALGRHLRNAVTTGLFCKYSPESPTAWLL